ncbi:MAG: lipid A biosynthesis lauroyl acyltransferase, partial [Pseudorhodoplanes sp.]
MLGPVAVGMLKAIRWTDPHRMSDFAGNLMRWFGPKLREHRIGQENLRLAFPEKTDEEIEKILGGVWDNLGRIGIEFAHLDHIWDHDPEKPGTGHI